MLQDYELESLLCFASHYQAQARLLTPAVIPHEDPHHQAAHALRQINNLQIRADGKEITLRGQVRLSSIKRAVERAASAIGFKKVVSLIEVVPESGA